MTAVEELDSRQGNTALCDEIQSYMLQYETCNTEYEAMQAAEAGTDPLKRIQVEDEYSLEYKTKSFASQNKQNTCSSFLARLRQLLDPDNNLGGNSFGMTRVYPN